MSHYVPGVGPFEPKLMIVGGFPSQKDVDAQTPFTSHGGYELGLALQAAGTSLTETYRTYAVKYQPPMGKESSFNLIGVDKDVEVAKLINEEIKLFKPNCILAIGEFAFNAVTGYSGILNYRGSILLSQSCGVKVVGTIDPDLLFGRFGNADGVLPYTWLQVFKHDVARAVAESNSSTFELPHRELVVAHDSLELYRFFRQYKGLDKVAVDIESINCVPVCVGFAFNKHHAISVPLVTKVGKFNFTDMSNAENNECWKLIDTALRESKIIGHNYKYDDFKLGLIGFQSPNVYSDTLIKTRVLFPELPSKKLNVVSSIWTREPYYKEEGKEFKIGKSRSDQLLLYNAKDCAVEFEVDEAQEADLIALGEAHHVPLVDYYYNYMMKKHKFYLALENNGFAVDFERKKELSNRYKAYQKYTHEALVELLDNKEINVKSYPQMYNLLYKELGFKPYKKDPTSEDSIVKLISTHCKGKDGEKKKKILETILEERRVRDQRSRYINFEPDFDRRCKTSYAISSTETCRSSTAILKKPIRPAKMGLAFQTISKHGKLAKDIRSMFVCDPGYVFIQADSSQAEARVVAVLSEDYELLEAFDKIDIHRRTAGLIFGLTSKLELGTEFIPLVDDIGKDSAERFSGKKTRHAGNYDMGEVTFMTSFNTDAQKFEINTSISQWKSREMLRLFHEGSPKIRTRFHEDIKNCLISTRTLIDPFGGVRTFFGRMDDNLFKEGFANIPQRTVAHLVQGAGIKCFEEFKGGDCKFIVEAHDALVMQVPANDWQPYAKYLQEQMMKPIDFSLYCSLKRDKKLVIPCDLEISETNYGAFQKVKL